MNTKGQVTVREWFALPEYERRQRIAVFREADDALQLNSYEEQQAGVRDETETYLVLNGRVNDLWPTVPWWIREPSTSDSVVAKLIERLGTRLSRRRQHEQAQ